MSETVSRRDFFKISGGAVAGVGLAVSGVASGAAEAAVNTSANLPYPRKAMAKIKGMKVNEPVSLPAPPAPRNRNLSRKTPPCP